MLFVLSRLDSGLAPGRAHSQSNLVSPTFSFFFLFCPLSASVSPVLFHSHYLRLVFSLAPFYRGLKSVVLDSEFFFLFFFYLCYVLLDPPTLSLLPLFTFLSCICICIVHLYSFFLSFAFIFFVAISYSMHLPLWHETKPLLEKKIPAN
ncbi:hypothetical protein K457DRAFT_234637 [Linnemannia elongata AG-77]|uniref:Uncharacterized protein n=1 Tax=Linnemannia elongata AG-77 TaxID=1314771 RepID=A0A197JDR7_9FUNG|nr:hypothetical protein K457DRAFT_234637 [Linnemannia elongata AG-77]